jgi:hypothetical protein
MNWIKRLARWLDDMYSLMLADQSGKSGDNEKA